MNLNCNPEIGARHRSRAQQARVISEEWFESAGYCLNCPSDSLTRTAASTAFEDHICLYCGQGYELKSSARAHVGTVQDGGYQSMMRRVRSETVPALMLMHYSPEWQVRRLMAIHPVFLTPAVIVKRRSPHRRANGTLYQMCNLNLSFIPEDGKIALVQDGIALPHEQVRTKYRASCRFADLPLEKRGWAALVLAAVRHIGREEFKLADLYAFEKAMSAAYPRNHHIREKIRQQTQILRDLGYIDFVSRGEYRTLSIGKQ